MPKERKKPGIGHRFRAEAPDAKEILCLRRRKSLKQGIKTGRSVVKYAAALCFTAPDI